MVHFRSTVAANCNTETQIDMEDWTDEHFPDDDDDDDDDAARDLAV